MTINELKGDLRELAIKRTKEHLWNVGIEFKESEDMDINLIANFPFNETIEGHDFWWGVYEGRITELSK